MKRRTFRRLHNLWREIYIKRGVATYFRGAEKVCPFTLRNGLINTLSLIFYSYSLHWEKTLFWNVKSVCVSSWIVLLKSMFPHMPQCFLFMTFGNEFKNKKFEKTCIIRALLCKQCYSKVWEHIQLEYLKNHSPKPENLSRRVTWWIIWRIVT